MSLPSRHWISWWPILITTSSQTFLFFETRSHVAKAGLEFLIFFCHHLPSSGIWRESLHALRFPKSFSYLTAVARTPSMMLNGHSDTTAFILKVEFWTSCHYVWLNHEKYLWVILTSLNINFRSKDVTYWFIPSIGVEVETRQIAKISFHSIMIFVQYFYP